MRPVTPTGSSGAYTCNQIQFSLRFESLRQRKPAKGLPAGSWVKIPANQWPFGNPGPRISEGPLVRGNFHPGSSWQPLRGLPLAERFEPQAELDLVAGVCPRRTGRGHRAHQVRSRGGGEELRRVSACRRADWVDYDARGGNGSLTRTSR